MLIHLFDYEDKERKLDSNKNIQVKYHINQGSDIAQITIQK